MKEKILVVLPLEKRHEEKFLACAKNAEVIFANPEAVQDADLEGVTVVIGNLPPQTLQKATNLKWVQLNSAGTDGYLVEGVLPKNAILTNATGAYGLAISEHMVGATLVIMKKFLIYHDQQKERLWKKQGTVTSIYGSTCLIVGLGDIGSEYAKRMKAMGSYVIGIRRTPGEKPACVDEIYTIDQLEDCIGRADVVATSLPGTKETYHLFNQALFDKMKDGAIFLNVGRGSAVDETALANALQSGKLRGASIDVSEIEPMPEDHVLWGMENLLITPHVSGGYHLPETLERIVGIALYNLEAYQKGTPMKSVVDAQTGYRRR